MIYHGGYTMTLIINRSWSFYGAFDHLWSWPFVKQFRLSWFSCERTEASSWPSRPPFLWLYFDLEVAHWMQCCTRKKNQRTLRTWHTNHTMTDLTWHGLKHGLKWSILIDKLIVSDCNGSHMEPWMYSLQYLGLVSGASGASSRISFFWRWGDCLG